MLLTYENIPRVDTLPDWTKVGSQPLRFRMHGDDSPEAFAEIVGCIRNPQLGLGEPDMACRFNGYVIVGAKAA